MPSCTSMMGTTPASTSRTVASRSISVPPDCIGKLRIERLFGLWLIRSGHP
jgi:hypothetical protein